MTSLHRAFYYYTTVRTTFIKPNWRLYIVSIHNRIQSCAEWPEQHRTSSCRYNHDGFNALTETEKEKLFTFILRSAGDAVSAVDEITRALRRAPNENKPNKPNQKCPVILSFFWLIIVIIFLSFLIFIYCHFLSFFFFINYLLYILILYIFISFFLYCYYYLFFCKILIMRKHLNKIKY